MSICIYTCSWWNKIWCTYLIIPHDSFEQTFPRHWLGDWFAREKPRSKRGNSLWIATKLHVFVRNPWWTVPFPFHPYRFLFFFFFFQSRSIDRSSLGSPFFCDSSEGLCPLRSIVSFDGHALITREGEKGRRVSTEEREKGEKGEVPRIFNCSGARPRVFVKELAFQRTISIKA